MTAPRAGDLVYVTRAASVQFVNPIMLRVIRVLDRPTYDGWIWLDGYQLDDRGDAVARRTIFVQPAGLLVQRAGRFVSRPVPSGPRPDGRAVPEPGSPGSGSGPASGRPAGVRSGGRAVPGSGPSMPRAAPAAGGVPAGTDRAGPAVLPSRQQRRP